MDDLTQALGNTTIGVASLVGVLLSLLIRRKVKDGKLRGVLLHVTEAVPKIVRSLEQTIVAGLKAAHSKDSDWGEKLTDKERAEVKSAAVEALKDELRAEGLALLAGWLGDTSAVDRYLSRRIEAAVHEIREGPRERVTERP